MKTKILVKTLSLLVLLAIPATSSACSFTNTALIQTVTPDLKPVYQTVEVILTRSSVASAPASVRTPAPASTEAADKPTQPAVSRSPEPADTELPPPPPCDLVAPGRPIDVTVEDGESFEPGQVFSKTWRLVNAGECVWTRSYSVVFFSGQPMGASNQQALPYEVQPGSTVDVTVDMVAPQVPGSYQSNWKLANESGELFGLGPNGDAPFWVQIVVVKVGDSETLAPAPSPTPPLPVYSAGLVKLLPADSLDLDSGSLNQDEFVDVVYTGEDASQPAFSPVNGARLSIYGADEPDETACQTAFLGETPLDLNGLDAGVYFCYRTSLGLPGYLHVVQPATGNAALSLDFVTWTVP